LSAGWQEIRWAIRGDGGWLRLELISPRALRVLDASAEKLDLAIIERVRDGNALTKEKSPTDCSQNGKYIYIRIPISSSYVLLEEEKKNETRDFFSLSKQFVKSIA